MRSLAMSLARDLVTSRSREFRNHPKPITAVYMGLISRVNRDKTRQARGPSCPVVVSRVWFDRAVWLASGVFPVDISLYKQRPMHSHSHSHSQMQPHKAPHIALVTRPHARPHPPPPL